jgi:CRISPR-associated protein Cas2
MLVLVTYDVSLKQASGAGRLRRVSKACKDYYYLGANWRRRVEHVGAKPATDLGGTLIV